VPVVPVVAASAAAAAGSAASGSGSERELQAFRDAVKARPQDIEAHLSLLRLLHMRGNYEDFEAAAQDMRVHVPSTLDPRWREVVIMGASLMPANAQFGEAGWNTPRFEDAASPPRAVEPAAPVVVPSTPSFLAEAGKTAPARAEPVKVFEAPAAEKNAGNLDELDFDQFDSALAGGSSSMDIHRSEAQVMDEDEASATRIELAKAYLDIGDLDGARSMLEEVVSEGGPAAQAEAGRILKEIG
jgi:pilus assembly protein FimV